MIGAPNGDETTPVHTSTAVFNVSDLYYDKVPMSIYSSQPWCAEWAYNNLWPFNSTWWTCPHTAPYKPIIKVAEDILRTIDPLWAECDEAFGGVYDPPQALRPAETAAGVTVPTQEETPTTPATQAPTPPPATAPATTAIATEAPVSKEPFTPNQPKPTSDDTTQSTPSGSHDNPSGSRQEAEDPGNENPASIQSTSAKPPKASSSSSQDDPSENTYQDHPADDKQSSVDGGILQEAIQSAIAAAQTKFSHQEDPADPQIPTNDPQVLTIASQTFSLAQADADATVFANAESSFSVHAGGNPVTVGSQVISGGLSNGLFVDGSATTLNFAQAADTRRPNLAATLGSKVFSLESGSGNVFVNAKSTYTLAPGAATRVGSDLISAALSGNAIVLGSGDGVTTVSIPLMNEDGKADPPGASTIATFEIEGTAYTAAMSRGSDGSFAICHDGTTSTLDGSVTTIDGQSVAFASYGVAVDGTTQRWNTLTMHLSGDVEAATFEIDSQIYTASMDPTISTAAIIEDGITLTVGGPGTTIAGHSVSLASGGIIVDGTRYPWTSAGTSSSLNGASKATTAMAMITSEVVVGEGATRSSAVEGTGPPSSTPTSGAVSAFETHSVFTMLWSVCVLLVLGHT